MWFCSALFPKTIAFVTAASLSLHPTPPPHRPLAVSLLSIADEPATDFAEESAIEVQVNPNLHSGLAARARRDLIKAFTLVRDNPLPGTRALYRDPSHAGGFSRHQILFYLTNRADPTLPEADKNSALMITRLSPKKFKFTLNLDKIFLQSDHYASALSRLITVITYAVLGRMQLNLSDAEDIWLKSRQAPLYSRAFLRNFLESRSFAAMAASDQAQIRQRIVEVEASLASVPKGDR